jgi:hypothetical protein
LAETVQDATGDSVEMRFADQGYRRTDAEQAAEDWCIQLAMVKLAAA